MATIIIVSLFLFGSMPILKAESDGNFTETHPILKLKSYRLFAKNRTVEQNETHFRLPRVFDELVFECTSDLPTKWNYFKYQAKTIEIKKWRRHGMNGTRDTFYSTFLVVLSNPNVMITLSCENVCPKSKDFKNCQYLNVYLQQTVTAHVSPGFYELQYAFGNKATRHKQQDESRERTVDSRLGWNKDCKYLLHVDQDAGTFACTLADGSEKEVPSIFDPCNNPDECDTVFRSQGDNCTRGTTFKPNCTSSICSELRETSRLFVIACGEYNEKSVARGFYKTLEAVQHGRKQLHEYKRKSVPFKDMAHIRFALNREPIEMLHAKNKSIIWTNYSRQFECLTLRSFFSHGFLWTLQFKNGTSKVLGTGEETTDDQAQLYISTKTISFDSPLISSVSCKAPNWNEIYWTNFTMPVVVEESIPPKFTEWKNNNFTSVKNKTVSITVTNQSETLTCERSGWPPALIVWYFDSIRPESTSTNASLVQHYKMYDDLDDRSEVVLQANHPFRDIVCVAENRAGTARTNFKFHRDDEETRGSVQIFVILGVVGCAVVVVIAVVVSAFYKIRKTQMGAYLTGGDIEEFFTGATAGHDAFLLPYDVKLEVSRESFATDNTILGSGTYGKVIKGNIGFLDVAIKITKSSSESLEYLKTLLSEVKVMSYVGSHPNIVNLIGACTSNLQKNELFVILEFCERGDLLSTLKKGRDKFIDLFQNSPVVSDQKSRIVSELVTSNMILSTKHLVHWALDVVDAMEYISSKNIIHGDLAARNVLITHDLKAKVSDFGLSKHMYSTAAYIKKTMVPLPTRWMAYESLKNLEFSIQSDLWMLGVTLWEMFSLGEIPYDKYLWDFKSCKLLADGIRLEKPKYASKEIYGLMTQTWNIVPKDRPSYSFIKETLSSILDNFPED